MATIEKQNPSLFSRYRTLDAVAGRKGRLLMALPLQLRKDVAEEHLLPLHQWKKKNGKSRMLELRPLAAGHGLN
jgi:hypothetical protein